MAEFPLIIRGRILFDVVPNTESELAVQAGDILLFIPSFELFI